MSILEVKHYTLCLPSQTHTQQPHNSSRVEAIAQGVMRLSDLFTRCYRDMAKLLSLAMHILVQQITPHTLSVSYVISERRFDECIH
jgi:hypothetical protein